MAKQVTIPVSDPAMQIYMGASGMIGEAVDLYLKSDFFPGMVAEDLDWKRLYRAMQDLQAARKELLARLQEEYRK